MTRQAILGLPPYKLGSRLVPPTPVETWWKGFGTYSQARKPFPRMDGRFLLIVACVWAAAEAHPSEGNACATIRATQSSLSDYRGLALNAIDRNTDTNYINGSCSRTAEQNSPWWSVDFFYHYKVYVVKITAGNNCGGLSRAEIRIGDNANPSGTENTICSRNVNVPAGQAKYFYCQPLGVHGRYMSISVPGRTTCLSLCEVEAYGSYDPH
ncbi:fucolectin-like isoform X2 [Narcine bancroftii]|uniref:fucolectin-like isoform X2 n=1 Tax=Narcine bancroftii TaxID=1343680 RepID=UPI0038322FDC